jgi:hypothetical protein
VKLLKTGDLCSRTVIDDTADGDAADGEPASDEPAGGHHDEYKG